MDYKDWAGGAHKDFFWFRAKRDLLLAMLFQAGLSAGGRILDLGCGTGDEIPILRSFGLVYAVDTDARALAFVPQVEVVEKKVGDIRSLDYPDGFFDAVVILDVLEHIENDTAAVAEIRRVLRPGGILISTVPAFPMLYSAHDKVLGHFRRYTKRLLRSRLEGFTELALNYWVCALMIPVSVFGYLKMRRTPDRLEYVALPRAVNQMLYGILRGETWLLKKGFPLPFGRTLAGIWIKNA